MKANAQMLKSDTLKFFTERAREIAEFCVRRGGRAFAGWPVPTLFAYALFHVVDRTVFSTREHGTIAGVGFMWGENERDIRSRAAAGQPVFDWTRSVDGADSLFLAEVVAAGPQLARLARQAKARFPDMEKKKIFTFRRGELVRIPIETVEKVVSHGRR